MQIVYSGTHDEVEIPDAGYLVAQRGAPIDVPDELAARLLEQDTWSTPETDAQRAKREQTEKDAAEQKAAADKAAAQAIAKVKAEQKARQKDGS